MVFRIGWRLRTEKKGLRKKDDVWRAEISGFRMHLERFSANGNIFVLRKRPVFSIHAKPTDKEKLFFSTPRQHFSTMPKLTCSYKFHPQKPTVSLQQNNPFSKLRSLASAVQLPFRTDSNPHRRYPDRLQYPARPVT